MSQAFRELLKKVGSGTHTSSNLSRAEAAAALEMMLRQEATPVQIGAFLIAHRIKRPTGEELAGMLDAYDALGPKVAAIASTAPVAVFSVPYDGRSRTASILPITALILAAAGRPALVHGGDRMATKYGVPLLELWQQLGIDWSALSLEQLQQTLEQTNLGLLYTSRHFPLSQPLTAARDQLGKRPPLATLELFWCPYEGDAHLCSGYVHPPTEAMMQEAFKLRGQTCYTTIKGLEGSCDLPRDRTAIIGAYAGRDDLDRLLLNARDWGLSGPEASYISIETWTTEVQQVLQGQTDSKLYNAVLWNAGFYLWHLGMAPTLAEGIGQTRALLREGRVAAQLALLQRHIPQKICSSGG
ncbi:anthranilate phosphoribosyltransferase family protein [Altericista sp. CCNU0014]|uniref:anthranilate phosphoribosyltransferase family protein n=1 Tax=Altericista sp. CCNU0014 TaxID=3082949 RepID=UPI00384C98FD